MALSSFSSPGNPYAGFFSSDRSVAERFAEGYATSWGLTVGLLHEVEITFSNPATIDADGRHAADLQFGRSRDAFLKAFEDHRCDGLVLVNTADEGTVFVPRSSAQILLISLQALPFPSDPPSPAGVQPIYASFLITKVIRTWVRRRVDALS